MCTCVYVYMRVSVYTRKQQQHKIPTMSVCALVNHDSTKYTTHIHTYVCVCTCLYVCICLYMCIYTCVCVYVYMCAGVYTCVCIYVYMCIHVNVHSLLYACIRVSPAVATEEKEASTSEWTTTAHRVFARSWAEFLKSQLATKLKIH